MKNGLVKKAIIGTGIVLSSFLPMKDAYGQSKSEKNIKTIKGFDYNSVITNGKEYKISEDSLMGQRYVSEETKVSKKNPTGFKMTPSSLWGFDYSEGAVLYNTHSDASYFFDKTDLTQLVLETEKDSTDKGPSVFALPSATFEISKGEGNPIGDSCNTKRIYPKINFITFTAPTGKSFVPIYNSPESDVEVANGKALNFYAIDLSTFKVVWDGKTGNPVARGDIYKPRVMKGSDMSKVFSTETKSIPYFATEFITPDSLKGDLSNYFTGKDSTGFRYEIPNEEMSKVDLKNGTISDSIPRTTTIEEGKNLILNYNFPKAFEGRIKSAERKTGQYLPTEESPKLKKPRKEIDLSGIVQYVHPAIGVNGAVKGFNHQDFSFGGNGNASFLIGKDFTIGPFVNYNFEKEIWKNRSSNFSSGKSEELIDSDKDISGNPVFRYAVLDSSTNNQISYLNSPLVIGGKINKQLLDNLYLNIGLGVGSRNVVETTTGNSTLSVEKRDQNQNLIDSKELEIGNEVGDRFENNLGKEKTLVFESGLEYFPGKENKTFSTNVNFKYITGIEGKSQNGDAVIEVGLNLYPFRR